LLRKSTNLKLRCKYTYILKKEDINIPIKQVGTSYLYLINIRVVLIGKYTMTIKDSKYI